MNERPRILVVDDTPEILELTTDLLGQAGYAVSEARCGEEALQQADAVRPDLILLDVVLPDLSGFEVCRRLKGKAGPGAGLIVLISSAETASERQAEGLEAGADGYIARPIPNRELLARVEALLRLKRAEDAVRASRAEALAHLETARAGEARFRELLESAPDAMLLVNADRRLDLVNRRCLELFGYAADELIGQALETLIPEVYGEREVGGRDGFLATPYRTQVGRDLCARRKDGSEFTAAVTLSPISGSEGIMVLAAVRDVTGRRRLEQAFARRTQHLEAIQHVTAEIARELSLDTLLNLIVRKAMELLEEGEVMLRLWDEGRQLLVPMAWCDSSPAGNWPPLRLGEGVAGSAAQRREGLIVNDFRQSPYATPALLEATTHTAVLAEPLLYRDCLIGVLVVNRHPGMTPFKEDDQRLIALFAGQAAIAIENARLHEEALEKTSRLEGLTRISAKIAASLRAEETLESIAEESANLLRIEGAGFRLLDGDRLVVGGRYGIAQHVMLKPAIRVGESLSGLVVERGCPIAIPDIREASNYDRTHRASAAIHGAISFLGVPLRYRGRIIGVLNIYGTRRRTFSEAEVNLLAAFADHAAIAIENARLHEAAVRRGEQVAALLRTARSLMEGLDLETTLDRIVAEAARISGCPHVKILMADATGAALRARAVQGTAMVHGQELPWGQGLSGLVARTGQPIFSADVGTDQRNIFAEQDRAAGLRTFLGLPIRVGGVTLGVLGFNAEVPREYSGDEVAYLSTFADQAGLAIQNAQLHAATQRRALQLATLYDLARSLTTALELPLVAERIMRATQALLPDSVGRLWEQTDAEGTLRLIASIGLRLPDGGQMFQVRPGRGLIGIAAETRQTVVSGDVTADPRFADPAWAKSEGLVSCLVLPLEYGATTLGFLTVFSRRPNAFGAEEAGLLRSFGDQAAVAIQNARLYSEAERQRARLKQILDSAVEGFYQTTPDGRFLAANAAMARILGYESPESLMHLVTDIGGQLYVDGERRKQFASLLAEQGRVTDFEIQLFRRDRSTVWVAVNARGVAGPTQEIQYYEGFIQDISERKQAEQLKADFVSFATHQLRTPLAGIKWLLELAGQDDGVPLESQGLIRDAQASTERLIKLVNDLLDVTRMERGKITVNPEAVNLGTLTAEVFAELEPLVREKGHRLVVERPPALPAAWADRQLLRQVVLNLASNAIKYTPAGGVVTVRMRGQSATARPPLVTGRSREAHAGSSLTPPAAQESQSCIAQPKSHVVELSIQDSGIGIPRDAQHRLFEKFFRADNVYAVETEGTGLGLYLVRLILDQSSGRIWCESEEGHGATFTFTVPAAEPGTQVAAGNSQEKVVG